MTYSDIKKVLRFMVILLVFSMVMDKAVWYFLNKTSDEIETGQSIGKINHYLKIMDSLEYCIYGSSKANHNINPSLIAPNGYNMGLNGRSIACASTLIKLLPKDKSQLVLLQIDRKDFFSEGYFGEDVLALAPKYHRNDSIRNAINKVDSKLLRSVFWSYDYNGYISSILKNTFYSKDKKMSNTGFDPIYLSKLQKDIFKQEVEKYVNFSNQKKLKMNKLYAQYLKDLAAYCKLNNKELVVFSAPEYFDSYEENKILMSNFCDYQKITYLDLSTVFQKDLNIDYWLDFGHLSHEGAKEFSLIFKMRLEKIRKTQTR